MTNELRAVDIHIVDDDADVRDGLAWLFDSRGYQSRTWDSGAALLGGALFTAELPLAPACTSFASTA